MNKYTRELYKIHNSKGFCYLLALQWITVILAMLGKIGAAAAFAVIYVWAAELFPTVVRNAGMGASSSCARIGGMASPYIADLVSISYHNAINVFLLSFSNKIYL